MAFKDISPPTAALISILSASILYGVNVSAFFTCLYILSKRRSHGNRVPWFILGGVFAQFIISTIHVGNGWRALIEAFIWDAHVPDGALIYFTDDPTKPTEVISKAIAIFNSIFADAILIWRLYLVWGRNIYMCIMPLLTMVAYTITYFIGLGKLVNLASDDFFVISQWLIAGLGLSLATHAIVTCLIAGKIWWTARSTGGDSGVTRYMSVVWIVLESGAIYSVAVIFVVAFGAMKTQVGGLASNIFVQLCSIVPTLILIRVGLGLTSDTRYTCTTHAVDIQFKHTTQSNEHELSQTESHTIQFKTPPEVKRDQELGQP